MTQIFNLRNQALANSNVKGIGDGTAVDPFIPHKAIVDSLGNPIDVDNPLLAASKLIDESGAAYGVKHIDNKPRVSAMPYLYDIAEGNIPNHVQFHKAGFNSNVTTVEEDVCAIGGKYTFPTEEMGMETVSDDNTQDIGTVIKGDATGDTVQSDAGGTETELVDADVDFTAATAVAVGDIVLLDPHGAQPEYGYVTEVAAHTLTIAGGFSHGGTAASRNYAVVDKSASTGAQVVTIHYLDGDFIEHHELVVMNGTTPVPTVNTDLFRINNFALIASGSNGKAIGNIDIRNLADTPIYGKIEAGYTGDRNTIFTVPANTKLFIVSMNLSASTPNDTKVQSCRFTLRANLALDHLFRSVGIMNELSEIVVTNDSVPIMFDVPLQLPEKTDFVLSAKGFTGFSGAVGGVIRGWTETA